MPVRRLSRNEIGQRGEALYLDLLPQIESSHHGRFVAIDVESTEYELADEADTASDQLSARCPDAQILVERIGYPAVFVARRIPSHS